MDVDGDDNVFTSDHDDRSLSPLLMSSRALQSAMTDALSLGSKPFGFQNQVGVLVCDLLVFFPCRRSFAALAMTLERANFRKLALLALASRYTLHIIKKFACVANLFSHSHA
jgi:hypothetical protein